MRQEASEVPGGDGITRVPRRVLEGAWCPSHGGFRMNRVDSSHLRDDGQPYDLIEGPDVRQIIVTIGGRSV